MKIDITSIDKENFIVKDVNFCGIDSILVTPNHVGTKFTQENKIFRSSIWSKSGELISGGLKKFCNFGENPENFPVPIDLTNCKIYDKLDGSLGIFDYVNDNFNIRSRGTVNAETDLGNGYEIPILKNKYPKIETWLKENQNYTILCEWLSDKQVIVLRYNNCPDFRLLGIVNKDDYSYLPQETVDEISKIIEVPRPETYKFDTIKNLMVTIQNLQDKEGVCIYSNNDQEIHKVKALKYLKLHHLKSELSSLSKVLDLYLIFYPLKTDKEFFEFIETTFDYEIAVQTKPLIDKIYDTKIKMEVLFDKLYEFYHLSLESIKSNRRECAALILTNYPVYSNILFKILDGNDVRNNKMIIQKIMYKLLELE